MLRKGILSYVLGTAMALCCPDALAQVSDVLQFIGKGDALRRSYAFEESLEAYSRALEVSSDSLQRIEIKGRMLLSENGLNMTGFVYRPSVLARERFSIDDFFLYYPLPDRSWRAVPNCLDTSGHEVSKALYAPEGGDRIYYSARDQEGIRNLYVTESKGAFWSLPVLINEHLTSDSDEIYPMFSPDGKSLYFASKGLYGVGGYDLYVSRWDEESRDWTVPVNMGFPYSSPGDDFLFISLEDGRTMFASNRDCGKDSVYIYVIANDNLPVRRPVTDPQELSEISKLMPRIQKNTEEVQKSSAPENVDIRRYMSKMSEVRALQDSISQYGMMLEKDREKFDMTEDAGERQRLADRIIGEEAKIPPLQDSLDRALALLQKIEMEFLFSGVIIDPEKLLEEVDVDVQGEDSGYAFTRNSMGGRLDLEMEVPEPKFDYSFKILDKGQFAEDNTIPDGIVYQIQIFSIATKAKIRDLKGLSPVFEDRTAKGRYIYRVGVFRTYNDVLSKLNTVKKRGFRSAFIVAFSDGKPIAVSKARAEESVPARQEGSFFELRVMPAGGELEPAIADGIRQQSSGKDIARITKSDGSVEYVAGPFDKKEDVDRIAEFVKAMGVSNVVVKALSSPTETNDR